MEFTEKRRAERKDMVRRYFFELIKVGEKFSKYGLTKLIFRKESLTTKNEWDALYDRVGSVVQDLLKENKIKFVGEEDSRAAIKKMVYERVR